MSALDPYLSGGANTKAGLGNTFSDGLGAFLGTFAGTMIEEKTKVYDTPLLSQAVGIVIGCILGLYLPLMIVGDSAGGCEDCVIENNKCVEGD